MLSGGVSNVSFSFRGNDAVREAMHASFLYHAIQHGMNMGIVNPAMLEVYDEVNKELMELVEDVLFDRREDSTERLLNYAETVKGNKKDVDVAVQEWRNEPLQSELRMRLLKVLMLLSLKMLKRQDKHQNDQFMSLKAT